MHFWTVLKPNVGLNFSYLILEGLCISEDDSDGIQKRLSPYSVTNMAPFSPLSDLLVWQRMSFPHLIPISTEESEHRKTVSKGEMTDGWWLHVARNSLQYWIHKGCCAQSLQHKQSAVQGQLWALCILQSKTQTGMVSIHFPLGDLSRWQNSKKKKKKKKDQLTDKHPAGCFTSMRPFPVKSERCDG